MIPDLAHELRLVDSGLQHIAGLDEAGRGALAGPVVAAAVVLPLDRFDLASTLDGVRDSKQMRPADRERWADRIWMLVAAAGIGFAAAQEVDALGLLPATRLAMFRAFSCLTPTPEYLLIDHLRLPEIAIDQKAITRGDQFVLSIAAASVLAKVARDHWMRSLGSRYPDYGFAKHKGYGTAMHRHAIQRLGPCPEHRRSYQPVQQALAAQS
jgi:ribonuclease HII